MLQQHTRELRAFCCRCHLWHTRLISKHYERASSFPQHKLQRGFFHLSKQWTRNNISGMRGWDHGDGGGDRRQETCLHVLTKQNQTRRATGLRMKQRRRRSRPTIHLSFNRKGPITWKLWQKRPHVQDSGRKITLDTEATLVRLPGTRSPVCWKYLLAVTGKDKWMSQWCNKSAAVGSFCDFWGRDVHKREERLTQVTSSVFPFSRCATFIQSGGRRVQLNLTEMWRFLRDVFPLMWTEKDRTKGCRLEVEVTQ